MRELLRKRIFPGFRIGEALLWICFHISWAIILYGLYYVTDQFGLPDFLSQQQFWQTQSYVLLVKAIIVIPFWWLFFILLRNVSLGKKLLLHVLTAPVYTLLTVGLIYSVKAQLLGNEYGSNHHQF